MPRNQIPPEVREFIRRDIRSVVQLEVLLLLHRTLERAWTVAEVSHELGIDPEIAETELASLEQLQLIRTGETTPISYQYGPKDRNKRIIVEELAASYAKQRVAIFSFILSESDSRIRRFAEAFRLIRGAE